MARLFRRSEYRLLTELLDLAQRALACKRIKAINCIWVSPDVYGQLMRYNEFSSRLRHAAFSSKKKLSKSQFRQGTLLFEGYKIILSMLIKGIMIDVDFVDGDEAEARVYYNEH